MSLQNNVVSFLYKGILLIENSLLLTMVPTRHTVNNRKTQTYTCQYIIIALYQIIKSAQLYIFFNATSYVRNVVSLSSADIYIYIDEVPKEQRINKLLYTRISSYITKNENNTSCIQSAFLDLSLFGTLKAEYLRSEDV